MIDSLTNMTTLPHKDSGTDIILESESEVSYHRNIIE